MAKVTLRSQNNPTTIEVPMLLDSGADVTLIPQSSIGPLGLAINSTESYELMAFDGRRTAAPVARLDLIVLARAFRGKFLVIDQECGILGRDILNHIAILLDGPGLTWKEQQRSEQ